MSSLGDMWSDLVKQLFPSMLPEEPSPQEEDDCFRHNTVYAAPAASMHQSFVAPAPSVCRQSFASPNDRQLKHNASVHSDSVLGVSPSAQVSARRQSFGLVQAPPTDVTTIPTIPFKDGSSQIVMRPPVGPEVGAVAEKPFGVSFLESQAYRDRENQFMISDPEDLIDVKVAEYFKANPQVYLKSRVTRTRPGVYSIYGREVVVVWEDSAGLDKLMDKPGQLLVKDGPLKQPFADYLAMKDTTAEYNGSVFQAKNNLQTIPKECRMTFNDPGCDYSRLDAMKVAKEQAIVREAAAKVMLMHGQSFAVNGLVPKHEKTVDMKFGNSMRHNNPKETRPPLGGSVRGLQAPQMAGRGRA